MKALSLLLLVAAMICLCGCQTTGATTSPLENLKRHDRAAGTAVGATIGTIGGAIVGHQRGRAAEGAAIGAVIGGGVGYVAGDIAARRRERFVNEAAFLESEIVLAREAVEVQEKRNAELKAKVTHLRSDIDSLEAKHRTGTRVEAERRNRERELSRMIEENNRTLEQFAHSIEYLEEVLRTSPQDDSMLLAKRAELEHELNRLKAAYNALTGYNTELADQYERLMQMR